MLEPHEQFAMVIADPPWVPSAAIREFPDDPSIAIDGGSDGLDLARTCCSVIDTHLMEGGSAVIQLGTISQVEAVEEHLERVLASPLKVIETRTHDGGVLAHLGVNATSR